MPLIEWSAALKETREQAPASSLDIFFNQLEDRVELNPKTTAPWRIVRVLA